MKGFSKLLIILLILIVIIYFAFDKLGKALTDEPGTQNITTTEEIQDSTFKNKQATHNKASKNNLVTTQAPNQNNTGISSSQAFDTTSSDSTNIAETGFTCDMAEKIIHELYSLRTTGKSIKDAYNYLDESNDVPKDFKTFADNLWKTQTKDLEPANKVIEKFVKSCNKIENK